MSTIINRQLNRKMQKILSLCMSISSTTECDVFFNYSPHVNNYDVDMYLTGWGNDPTAKHLASNIKVNDKNADETLLKLYELQRSLKDGQ